MTLDIGTGDGRALLAAARRDPARLFLGIDNNPDGLDEAARRAARKPSRGGVANARFLQAGVEDLAADDLLHGVADRVTVLLPWGSLLTGVLLPDPRVLDGLRAVARPGAALEVVVSLDGRDSPAQVLPPPDLGRLAAPYRTGGWRLRTVKPLDREALADVGTTWAKRLAYGRPRPAWRLTASAAGRPAG